MRSNFFSCSLATLCLVLCCVIAERGYSQSAEELFRTGVSAFQKNDLDQARTQFTQSLKLTPDNVQVLYNLGLTEYKVKHAGLALGLWRKALAFDPSSSELSSAIDFAEKSLQQRPIARSGDFFESLHHSFLQTSSLLSFITINLLLFAFAGWILIRFFAGRSRAIENDEPTPAFPYVGVILSLLLVISLIFLAAKAYDLTLTRATIVAEKVEVKTSPEASAATLFELFEGLEVVVRQSKGDWMQVAQAGGLSGWVPANLVFVTSGLTSGR